MSQRDWDSCCTFFEIEEDISANTLLHFPGLKSPVAPYQLQAAYLLVRHDGGPSHLRGGYLADKMGLGKSLETILVILLRRLIRIARNEVEKE
jgi:SNF2 family DNA or RNA helicase